MRSTIGNTLKHVAFLDRHLGKCDLPCKVVAVLLELGIPANYVGFEYLKQAILMFCEDPVPVMLEGVYLRIIANCGKYLTEDQVQQAMYSAIKIAWKNRNEKVWIRFFSQEADGRIKRPRNTEFISRIGRFMELWQGYCAGEGSNDGE